MSEPKPMVPQGPRPNVDSVGLNTDLKGILWEDPNRNHLEKFVRGKLVSSCALDNGIYRWHALVRLVHCHLPRFSCRHGMIPNLYVMPWKQDMKYRKIKLKHAELVGLYSGAPEDTLFLDKSERHCHGEDRKQLLLKVPQEMAIADIPIYSHLSRYHKSIVAYGFRIKL